MIEKEVDTVAILSSYFPEWMDISQNVKCPFHDDNLTPSLHIDPSGKGFCHACSYAFSNIVDLVAKMEDITELEAIRMIYSDVIDAIPEHEIEAYVRVLSKNKQAMSYLKRRKISEGIIHKFKLGFEPSSNRITIPIYDRFGFCRNIRRMGWLPEHRTKTLNSKGRGEVRLFPEKTLLLKRRILLVEGEWDALCGMSHGLDCVTWTGGASNVNKKFVPLFNGKAVWIMYDNDSAGVKGALLNYSTLNGAVAHKEILEIPKRVGKDLTDLTKAKDSDEWIYCLKDVVESYKFSKHKKKDCYCPTCGQITKGIMK